MSLKLSPEPETIRLIRAARQFSIQRLANESKIPASVIEEVETSRTELTTARVRSLAKALAVPPQYLFFKKLEIDGNLPDFRTTGNKPAVLSSSGLMRVRRAKSIVNYLDDEVFINSYAFETRISLHGKAPISEASKALKDIYIPVYTRLGDVDPVATFRETRINIEKKGVIVLCDRIPGDEFRGFCYSEPNKIPLILINTANQRPATKLFTLMHEIVHVLLGLTGVSDPSKIDNKTEQFCNKVTASVMMPEIEFRKHYAAQKSGAGIRTIVNNLARHFGVSKSAAAIRVSELKLDAEFYNKWIRALPPNIPRIEEEDEAEEKSGSVGGVAAQISRFGYFLPTILGQAVNRQAISIYDAYRLTRLKPSTFAQVAKNGERRLGR